MFSIRNRGQVGIGTLIVFIAMVLVAAIAAGVLINTAGLLQAQAQQTGEETTAEVSDVLQIQQVVGSDTTSNDNEGNITQLNASIRLASGSDSVDMNETSYTISSPGGSATVISGNMSETGPLTYYQVQGFDNDENEMVLKDQEDVINAEFNLSDTETGNQGGINGITGLSEKQTAKLIVQAPAGGQSYTELQTPTDIEDNSSYIL